MRIAGRIDIDEREISERFVRASGPGGQNVNKVSTAVELRFDVRASRALPPAVARRLERLAGRRLTDEGVLVIRAERFRTQEQNRADARARLAALVEQALVAPKPRIPTKPSRAERQRRLQGKTHRSGIKKLRSTRPDVD
jgi:ribosome-associated protein